MTFCCPRCRGALDASESAYHCAVCAADYPVLLGIPDFRVFPDPYLDIVADRDRGRVLAEQSARTDFAGLLEHYWSTAGDTPATLWRRYVRNDLVGVARGEALLSAVERELKAPLRDRRSAVDLGCRSGGLLVAAARRGLAAVGVDIAFRWLVVAKKRLDEAGISAPLVCCCAQFLPFEEASVDLVLAGNVLEHTPDPQRLLSEAHRVLRPGGTVFGIACNRYSLGPEPHVRLLGVGFLPRRSMSTYVRWRSGRPYPPIRLPSAAELRRLLVRAGFQGLRLGAADVAPEEQHGLGMAERGLLRLYRWLLRRRSLRPALLLFGPLLQFSGVRTDS